MKSLLETLLSRVPLLRLLLSRIPWQFIRFGVVGTGGFLVNLGVFSLMTWIGLNPFAGQAVALPVAAFFTWLINRLWTFESRHSGVAKLAEVVRYLLSTALGAGINYAVFALLVSAVPAFHAYPKLGVAAAAIAGLCFNFPMSKYFVFRQRPASPTGAAASLRDP